MEPVDVQALTRDRNLVTTGTGTGTWYACRRNLLGSEMTNGFRISLTASLVFLHSLRLTLHFCNPNILIKQKGSVHPSVISLQIRKKRYKPFLYTYSTFVIDN
jgi:hypothetical protein